MQLYDMRITTVIIVRSIIKLKKKYLINNFDFLQVNNLQTLKKHKNVILYILRTLSS